MKKVLKKLSTDPEMREEFWNNVNVLGENEELNQDAGMLPAESPTSWSLGNCSVVML